METNTRLDQESVVESDWSLQGDRMALERVLQPIIKWYTETNVKYCIKISCTRQIKKKKSTEINTLVLPILLFSSMFELRVIKSLACIN